MEDEIILQEKPRTTLRDVIPIVSNIVNALLLGLYAVILYAERDSYSHYTGDYYDSFFDYTSEMLLGFAAVFLGVNVILMAPRVLPRLRKAKAPHPPKAPKEPKQAKTPKAVKPSKPIKQPQDLSTVTDTLRQYKAMLDEGLITEEEFAGLKAKLLGLGKER